MFKNLTGTSTAYSSTGITDLTKSLSVDYYRGWRLVLNSVEYEATSNTANFFAFSNSIAANAAYYVQFMTRAFLGSIDDQINNVTLVPNTLLNNKIEFAKKHIEQKIYAQFQNIFSQNIDPLPLVGNLYQIQIPFAYLVLAEIFSDLLLNGEDINAFKENKYRAAYMDTIKGSLSLLAVDMNQDGALDNTELSESVGGGGFFGR